MKMAATWFRSARGLAIGAIVGALTVGKASPYLVEAVGGATLGQAVGSTSVAAVAAAILIAVGYRDGPHAFPQRPFSWRLVGTVARVRELRLVTGGYLGHMWELYAYWTWLAAFLAAGGVGPATAVAFAGIAIGVVGCLWGGWAADRLGRERVVIWALAVSGTCAILAGLLHDTGVWLLAPLVLVWGVAVVADSAQFSALVTEVVPSHAVGTALTLQTSLGFLLTMVSIQMVPVAVAAWGWQWAFPLLAAGPSLGIIAMRRLQALRRGTA
jgi:nitrate/nitrite transporter NarK